MNPTPDQTRASSAAGSVAVIAGAGTGKTSMLASRYLHHVTQDGMSPLSVVAVTFTDKAADELRSRIRKTLKAELADERVVAEIEAAQISTIHALAARICQDFYYLAGIPADFTVLDDIEKPLWVQQKFDEAVGSIEPVIIESLGYNWLISALHILLKDPVSSERALSLGAEQWRSALEKASAEAEARLTTSEQWREAFSTISSCGGAAGDKLEVVRSAVLETMRRNARAEELHSVLKNFARNKGAASNWAVGDLAAVRNCLGSLKDLVKELYEEATFSYGPEDEGAALKVEPLHRAYRVVRDFIAAEKLREHVLDFTDLEQYALKILRSPEAVRHYQLRWHAFLIDEFQDTNPIQAEILELLTRDARLSIVGDEKQAIYGFRGADAEVFARFRESIIKERNGIEVSLARTFRANPELTAAMNALFEPILGELHQSLKADRKDVPLTAPHIRCAVVEQSDGALKADLQVVEAQHIADQIIELHEQGVAFRDIGIISRTWAPLEVYLDILSANNIPAVHAGGGSLLATREALDLYALMSFLSEPNDDIPLVALLRSPFFAVSDRSLYEAALGHKKGRSWWNLINASSEFSYCVKVLNRLLGARDQLSAGKLFKLLDNLTGYSAVIANLPHGERRYADLRGVQELFRRLERQGNGDVFGTTRYLKELMDTETEIPRPPLDVGEAVSLMTIHKAKGLEWPVVVIPDLAREKPNKSSPVLIDPELGVAFQIDGDGFEKVQPSIHKLIKLRKKKRDMDEAKRLLYVAITRAEDKVILTATSEKGFAMDLLRPGLEAAGIAVELIPYGDTTNLISWHTVSEEKGSNLIFNVDPVNIGLREIPVTALTAYAKCPRQFKFQYVDGHPGLSDGSGDGKLIGSLTHLALEHGSITIEDLRRVSGELRDELLSQALALAEQFRTEEVFAEIRASERDREVRFASLIDGIRLNGIADLVGPDFVLDYKTDQDMDPDAHRFQLAAYADALNKPKAYIAYLRHGVLHEFTAEQMQSAAAETSDLLNGIYHGRFEPTPSVAVCSVCLFGSICAAKAVEKPLVR